MKQIDFEKMIVLDTKTTHKLVSTLIKSLTSVIYTKLLSGQVIIIPNFGRIFIYLKTPRNYHNIHSGELTLSTMHNIVKFRTSGYVKQQLTPSWKPVKFISKHIHNQRYTFLGIKTNNDSDVARAIRTNTGIDLLTINNFVNSFIKQVILAMQLNQAVSINNLGTFKKVQHQGRSGRNPATGATIYIAPFATLRFLPSAKLINAIK